MSLEEIETAPVVDPGPPVERIQVDAGHELLPTSKPHLHQRVMLDVCEEARRLQKRLTFAELGVWRGKLSQLVADKIPDAKLILVDRWSVPPKAKLVLHTNAKDNTSLKAQRLYDGALLEVRRRMGPFADRVAIYKGETEAGALMVPDGSVDVGFVDGGHYYAQVLADAKAWWPKIAEGGYLCGHDYGGTYQGVTMAVKKFARKIEARLWVLDGHIWLIEKPKGGRSRGLRWPQHKQRVEET